MPCWAPRMVPNMLKSSDLYASIQSFARHSPPAVEVAAPTNTSFAESLPSILFVFEPLHVTTERYVTRASRRCFPSVHAESPGPA